MKNSETLARCVPMCARVSLWPFAEQDGWNNQEFKLRAQNMNILYFEAPKQVAKVAGPRLCKCIGGKVKPLELQANGLSQVNGVSGSPLRRASGDNRPCRHGRRLAWLRLQLEPAS